MTFRKEMKAWKKYKMLLNFTFECMCRIPSQYIDKFIGLDVLPDIL